MIKTSPGYRIYLHRLRGTARSPSAPRAPWHNAVLQSHAEAKEAQLQVNRLGLPEHATLEKNWDTLAALDAILQEVPRDGWILDAGAELHSTVLPSLFLYGYRNLHGINLEFSEPIRHGTIVYAHGDLEDTPYPDGRFDVIVCQSVIEHGVDVTSYLREAARLLRAGRTPDHLHRLLVRADSDPRTQAMGPAGQGVHAGWRAGAAVREHERRIRADWRPESRLRRGSGSLAGA